MYGADSPRQRLLKNSVHSSLNETANGLSKAITSPKITSTPLHSTPRRRDPVYATPPKTHLLSPKK